MSEKIPARFRKTKTDKWAVMAPVEDLEQALAGDGRIEVLKRSGDTSTFTVGSLGRPFDVDGVKMCYGYAPGDEDEAGPSGGDQAAPSPSSGNRDRSSSAARPGPGGGGARGGPARRQPVEPPPRDETEPLPEYRGGAEDEWDPGHH